LASVTAPAAEGQVTEQNPIINNPYVEPTHHWVFGGGEPRIEEGRRPSGYLPPVTKDGQLQITDQVILMEHVNNIRGRVRQWREDGYPGATAITRELFDRWFDPENEPGAKPFFAQRESIEAIAFLTEAPDDRRVGIAIPRPEAFERWATKLATGTGKTLVMSMVISWSGLNKAANKQDTRFADAFLVVAPNLTVKDRLRGIGGLDPNNPQNLYRDFNLIPAQFSGLFGQVRVMVTNWHQLAEETDPKRSVMKRGRESDAAFCNRVLRPLGSKKRIMVLNDEAHHAWRPPPGASFTGDAKKEAEEATVWIQGLERIHRDREILRCLDFSATPMYPGSIKGKAWQPFEWIVSDFALVDAIESGLVKIPRIPTDDNSGRAIPKYRNLWEHVKSKLPKRGEDADETHPLTDYLTEVDGPLKQLAGEWEETYRRWRDAGRTVPPVMIVVCNDTKMAELLDTHIAKLGEAGEELRNRNGDAVTVRIDSKLLEDAELRDEAESAQDAAERVRRIVSTVGKECEPGEQVRCLISVSMLSEGWDARNVTQILGLRAFQSQLLCEQVVGRGLRRTDYTDLSRPEYVDVYGVPFQLLPFAKAGGGTIIEPPTTTNVHTVRDREALKVEWPRVTQIIPDVGDTLVIAWDDFEPVVVSPENDPTATYVEFEVGAPGKGLGNEVQDRSRAYERFRMQSLHFRLAAQVVNHLEKPWLFPQAVRLASEVIQRKVAFEKDVDPRELCNMRYLSELRNRWIACLRPETEGDERLVPVLDQYEPIGSTEGIAFSTSKPCEPTVKSHISHVVADSKLEVAIAHVLEEHKAVEAYAKNDRLFLEIPYRYLGTSLRYRPDFVVNLTNGRVLLIEGKGRKDEKDDAKSTAAKRWVAAVNTWGKLGIWSHHVCFKPEDAEAAVVAAAGSARLTP
jgi:type III restriction enzyme